MDGKVSAPRKEAGKPSKDVRRFCKRLTLTACDEEEERILAVIYRTIFNVWNDPHTVDLAKSIGKAFRAELKDYFREETK